MCFAMAVVVAVLVAAGVAVLAFGDGGPDAGVDLMAVTPLVLACGDGGLGCVGMVDVMGFFCSRNIFCRPFKYVDACSAASLLLKSSGRKVIPMLANDFKASCAI